MTSRQAALLAAVIEEYIQTLEPVSSKSLEKSGGFGVSSATIRAEMNDLENIGYLSHLYTSSGRVPTAKAYRYFVDNIVADDCDPDDSTKRKIKQAIASSDHRDPGNLNKTVGELLSSLSNNIVITNILERDEFFKTGISRMFEFDDVWNQGMALNVASFFDEFENIFESIWRDFAGVPQTRASQVQVFIGRENPLKNLKDETTMFARYRLPRNFTGSITLVGPMRMDYRKNVGIIKYAAEELNKLAKSI